MGIEEKRKHERFNFKVAANCKIDDRVFQSYVWDISFGGLRLELPKKPREGAQVDMVLDTHIPIKLSGNIQWFKRDGLSYICGVQFKQLDENQKENLKQVIRGLYWQNSNE